jgi:hypothetical protein
MLDTIVSFENGITKPMLDLTDKQYSAMLALYILLLASGEDMSDCVDRIDIERVIRGE